MKRLPGYLATSFPVLRLHFFYELWKLLCIPHVSHESSRNSQHAPSLPVASNRHTLVNTVGVAADDVVLAA